MNENKREAAYQNPFLEIIISFILGPLLIIYGLFLLFFVVNGVSGSNKWLSNYWKKFGKAGPVIAIGSGVAIWAWILSRQFN